MQQLLGDQLGSTDSDSFLKELFLQWLPPNVRIILASADNSLSLGKLAELADKIMEVALRAEVAQLRELIQGLSTRPRRHSFSKPHVPQAQPILIHLRNLPSVGTTGSASQKCHKPCSHGLNTLAGRLRRRVSPAMLHTVAFSTSLISFSGTQFLVDTGSEVSVIRPHAADRRHKGDSLTLQAVNNTPITTYGTRSLMLNLGLRRTFQWVFIIADVQKPHWSRLPSPLRIACRHEATSDYRWDYQSMGAGSVTSSDCPA